MSCEPSPPILRTGVAVEAEDALGNVPTPADTSDSTADIDPSVLELPLINNLDALLKKL